MATYSFLQESKKEEETPEAQEVNTQSLSTASTSKHTIFALMKFLLSQDPFIMLMQQKLRLLSRTRREQRFVATVANLV